MNTLLLRAILVFLAVPTVVAIVIPLGWLYLAGNLDVVIAPGWGILGLGFVALVWCVRDFYVIGKGTLAPWEPPEKLVVVGLYRYSRNPMYVSVLLMLIGWAMTFGDWPLVGYAAVVAVGFHLRVTLNEEPFLAEKHGTDWEEYSKQVGRWLW